MRDLPLFPVTTVGSLPRTPAMAQALRARQGGRLEEAEFQRVADAAVAEAVALQEAAGVDIITDGEQPRDNFYSFLAGKIDGVKLMTLADMLAFVEDKAAFERLLQALDVPAFAIKNPVVTGRLAARAPLAADDLARLRRLTDKPVKVALPGPYLLTRSMWVKSLSSEHYPDKEALGDDVVAILRAELLALAAAGCEFVQFDEPVLSEVAFAGPHATHSFMCAALSEKRSPEAELAFAVELLNRVVAGVEGVRIGLHVCRGNWSKDEKVLLAGAYDALVPTFAAMDARQFVLEFATERAGDPAALAALPAEKEIGLGAVDPRTDAIEEAGAITAKVRRVLAFRAPERVFLNPDCGFGTFADRPVATWEVARRKLAALAEAAAMLRAEVGAPRPR